MKQVLIITKTSQHTRSRNEKRRPRQGGGIIQDPIMQSRRVPNEHPLQHLLNDPQLSRVPDEIGAKFVRPGRPERHVVTEDVVFTAGLILNRRQGLVGHLLPLVGVVEFNVVDLRAADDGLLRLGRQPAPPLQVVHVLLHDDVAPSRGPGVFVGHDDRRVDGRADGVRRAVDEAQKVPGVKVPEPDGLVDHRHRVAQQVHDLALEFEAQVAPLRPDVEQDVSRRRHGGVHLAFDLLERVELGRSTDTVGEYVPGVAADADRAREQGLEVAERHVLDEVVDARENGAHGFDGRGVRVDGQDEERRRRRQWGVDALGFNWHSACHGGLWCR